MACIFNIVPSPCFTISALCCQGEYLPHKYVHRNGPRLAPIVGIAYQTPQVPQVPEGKVSRMKMHPQQALRRACPTHTLAPNRTIGLSCSLPLDNPNHQLLICGSPLTRRIYHGVPPTHMQSKARSLNHL